MWEIVSGILLGGTLGANDSANIFGTAVSTKTLKFETAVALTSTFVVIGAALEGTGGIHTLGSLAEQTLMSAFITSLAAALTVALMTFLGLPISTSQAVVGAIIGAGILKGNIHFAPLGPIVIAWVTTPLGAALISYLIYKLYIKFIDPRISSIGEIDYFVKIGLIVAGIYGAYSLGANNVANVMGVYVKAGLFSPAMGGLIGGMSIGLGVIYSRRVMITVGSKITRLTPLTALIAVLAHSITLYIYARLGIPVSSSQAIVGGVVGVGLVKNANLLDWRTIKNILFGWIGTPSVAAVLGIILSYSFL
ncbi:MAG: inorganic phosphate transporter [Halanaerobiales bacterium]